MIKIFECFAGVMIGREIIFKKIAKSGKQIIGITFVQSIGTFLFVSAAFSVVFVVAQVPVYLAFVFGGIALATAPAPALSIVNEYHTSGPVTKTLLPLTIIGMVMLPFVIGITFGFFASVLMKAAKKTAVRFCLLLLFLLFSAVCGLLIDCYVYQGPSEKSAVRILAES